MFQGPSAQANIGDSANDVNTDQVKPLTADSTADSAHTPVEDRSDATADAVHQPACCQQNLLQQHQVKEQIPQQDQYQDQQQELGVNAQQQRQQQQQDEEAGSQEQLDLDDLSTRWSCYDPLLQFQVITEQARQRREVITAEQTLPAVDWPAAAAAPPPAPTADKPVVTAAAAAAVAAAARSCSRAAEEEQVKDGYISVAARKNAYIAAAQKLGSSSGTAQSEHPNYELSLAALRSSFMAAAAAAPNLPNSATPTDTTHNDLGSLAVRKSSFLAALETSASVAPPAAPSTPNSAYKQQVYLSTSCDGSSTGSLLLPTAQTMAAAAPPPPPPAVTQAAAAAASKKAVPGAAAIDAVSASVAVARGWNAKTREVAEMAAALLQSHNGQLEATQKSFA